MAELSLKTSTTITARPRKAKRLLLIAVPGLLLIAAAGFYLYLTYHPSVGSGPAGPVVETGAFGKVWTTNRVMLVGLGDSVTAGFGARKGYSYFDRLAANPQDEFTDLKNVSLSSVFPNLVTTNLAVSGTTSFEAAEGQLSRLPTSEPHTVGWVVITTGGNDLIHNYGRTPPREQAMYGATWDQAKPWVEGFERRLERIFTGVQQRFPGGCHIFLANIYDPSDGVGDIEKAGLPPWPDGARILSAYNEVIQRCAQRQTNVHLVNLYDTFLGHGIHSAQFWSAHYNSGDPHYWYYTNLEDPNERGYDAVRRVFLNEMAKIGLRLN